MPIHPECRCLQACWSRSCLCEFPEGPWYPLAFAVCCEDHSVLFWSTNFHHLKHWLLRGYPVYCPPSSLCKRSYRLYYPLQHDENDYGSPSSQHQTTFWQVSAKRGLVAWTSPRCSCSYQLLSSYVFARTVLGLNSFVQLLTVLDCFSSRGRYCASRCPCASPRVLLTHTRFGLDLCSWAVQIGRWIPFWTRHYLYY